MTLLKSVARNALVTLAATAAIASGTAQADYQYGFANIYADYLNWGNGTKDLSNEHVGSNGFDIGTRDEHVTIGIEAGAGFSWGEMYGFYEYEKINWASKNRDQAWKVSAHYRLADSDVTLYGQVYDINDQKFDSAEQNRVVGLGYLGLTGNGWWFKPWVGIHDLSFTNQSDDFQGSNGYMVGWSAGASFEVAGVPLMVTNWNEIELNRNDDYAKASDGKTGLNGGVGVWYDINETFYTGVQYRYFKNKLGWEGYGDAMIYRVGMHL